MQKTDYPENHHYAQRGVDRSSLGWTDRYDTQYGHTCLYCRLELHVGDHLFRKRGGSSKAMLPDEFDYRYESLAMSLGVYVMPDKIIGALLGNFYDQVENDVIRFRISEDFPTHTVIFWEYDEETLRAIKALEPTAISVSPNMKWFQAVFSLARKNDVGPSDKFYDDFYDLEPDAADIYGSHWGEDLPESEIISERLHVCGF